MVFNGGGICFYIIFSKDKHGRKSLIAEKLLSHSRKDDYAHGTPTYPIITENTRPNSLVGENSWTLFNLLGHKADWLKNHPLNGVNMTNSTKQVLF